MEKEDHLENHEKADVLALAEKYPMPLLGILVFSPKLVESAEELARAESPASRVGDMLSPKPLRW